VHCDHESQSRQGDRPHAADLDPAAWRRGDRIARRIISARRWGAEAESWLLQLHVLQRARVREAADQVDARLLHARADTPDERQLVERDVRHPVVEDLLDLVEQRLALLHVELADLTLEEILDLGDDAGRVGATLADV